MSALCLSIPLHGERVPVCLESSPSEINFVFHLEDVLFERVEDTLQLYFTHNISTLVLENFYKIYNAQSYPIFIFESKRIPALDIINHKVGSYVEYGKSYYEVDELPAPDEVLASIAFNFDVLPHQQLDLSAFTNSSYIKALRSGNDTIIQVGESIDSCLEITLKNLGEFANLIEKELQNQSCKGIITL